MSREFLDHLEDIVENLENAELFVKGVTFEQFSDDARINYAVVRALEIVGEATKRLPADFRKQHPQIPWGEMAGMRDRVIYGYDTVNLYIVWSTVKQRIPEVKAKVQRILDQYES